MTTSKNISRRAILKGLGAVGLTVATLGPNTGAAPTAPPGPRAASSADDARKLIANRVQAAPLIDTHEHLLEERERLQETPHPRVPCDDWALLFSHYLNSDFLTAGMPKADMTRFLSPTVDPLAKWRLIAPYWPAVRHTGYAQAVRIALRELYGVAELSENTIAAVQRGYERTRRAGFYKSILQDRARIESCQI
ncbi:MAG: hypothetical protein NT049_01515, partial [Planctomycetota bacterium]|nr:hypothetical protein [Planctomycetota bacterium]